MSFELEVLARKFAKQAQRSLATFNATDHVETGTCCSKSHAPTRANCVLNLNNYWSDFCRSLLIESARGGAVARSGNVLVRAPGLTNGADIMSELRSRYRSRPPYWEPNWTVASDYIYACRQIRLVNLTYISAAIGSTGTPADELRLSRNYLAHRNASTATNAVRSLNAYGAILPLDIDNLLRSPVRPNTHLFKAWVDDLTVIAFAAV